MIPILVAHRGYMHEYPENSYLGLKKALDAGACMIEFDVQVSADRELVVIHDADLNRTAGVDQSVFEMTMSELGMISVHEPERFGDDFYPTTIPELQQIMTLVASYPNATAFVEIKDESLDRWGLEWVMDKLQQALKPYAKQVAIISFNYEAMTLVKQNNIFPAGWVLELFDRNHRELAEELEPAYLICNHKKIPDGISPWLGPWQWMLYDITDPALALDWSARDIELIETRDIGSMLKNTRLAKKACSNHA